LSLPSNTGQVEYYRFCEYTMDKRHHYSTYKELAMPKLTVCGGIVVLSGFVLGLAHRAEAAKSEGPMLVHDVFFTLKDNSTEAKRNFVAACRKYLTKHPGEVFFAAGPRAQELKRDVNDQDFDVALQIVFKDQAAHDKYQDSARHKQFIKENKDKWTKVRVFDSVVEK
jgi:hypothetical protein